METKALTGNNTGLRLQNPFALKVGQVFTGFGIGCGVGIGVGRPLNLGAIPVLHQVTSAARGATDALSGVGRHVNSSLRKIGAKNIEVGIGCGVGFGHGFGVGLAIKPGVISQLQSCLGQVLAKVMMKFEAFPGLVTGQNILPEYVTSSSGTVNEFSTQKSIRTVTPFTLNTSEIASQGQTRNSSLDMGSKNESSPSEETPLETFSGSRAEVVINDFLQSPLLNDEGQTNLNELAGRLKSENSVLQMVLKHQQLIEVLTEENERLRRVLVEELKVPPSKLEVGSTSGVKPHTPCLDCFECRRRRRKVR